MRVAIVVATHGADTWDTLAKERALPSTVGQGADDVVHVHRPDGTLAQARNDGAAIATGLLADMLVFLDADDELSPGYVDAMRVARERETAVWTLLSPAVVYVRRGNRMGRPKLWPRMAIEDGNWMVIGTAVPSSLFSLVGGFHEWPMYEDWCLWQRCMKEGAIAVDVPDAVYVAHASTGSRNRGPSGRDRIAAHNAIRRANYPELYEEEKP